MKVATEMPYRLVAPDQFSADHVRFLAQLKEAISVVAAHTNVILGAKDIHSRHLISTNDCVRHIEELKGEQTYAMQYDLFSESVPRPRSQSVVDEDQRLLREGDIGQRLDVISVCEVDQHTHAVLFDKQLLKHPPSRSILGTIYRAALLDDMDDIDGIAIVPDCILAMDTGTEVGTGPGPGRPDQGNDRLAPLRLSEYEREVGFLIVMNWSCRLIADFLNRYRPRSVLRGADTIYKCRNRICDKLGISDYSNAGLKAALLRRGLHRRVPRSFFRYVDGATTVKRSTH